MIFSNFDNDSYNNESFKHDLDNDSQDDVGFEYDLDHEESLAENDEESFNGYDEENLVENDVESFNGYDEENITENGGESFNGYDEENLVENDVEFFNDEENLAEEVHISTTLSSKKIMELIDKYPNLKIVTCPNSIYDRISKKYLEALEKLGIVVKIKYNWGKPPKYTENDRINVVNLIKKGLFPQDIAEKLNLSVQTVYYLKNKNKDEQVKLKRGKRRKYSNEIREKVRKLANDGVPTKKISKTENIPLRTVYDIINEK